MIIEDNNGFINFPNNNISCYDGRTLVYLISFRHRANILSNVNIFLPGDFISDNIVDRTYSNNIPGFNFILKNEYDTIYFPNNTGKSIPLISSICVGWSENSYEDINGNPWKASFNDLTEDGKRLYYSITKLHNQSEIRILTFNNV